MSAVDDELVAEIRRKKELQGIAESVIRTTLERALVRTNFDLKTARQRERKQLIKAVRAQLRVLAGRFTRASEDRQVLLACHRYHALLRTHPSTAARLKARAYPVLRKKIAALPIKTILDLGCGLNPLALATPRYTYYAVDIREDELAIVAGFFQHKGVKGAAFVYDLVNLSKPLPVADLCILMNVFDVLERHGHKHAERIITKVHAPYLLISFSTKTLSGKPMNHPQRGWIERLLHRLGYTFSTFTTNNEIFYLARNPSL